MDSNIVKVDSGMQTKIFIEGNLLMVFLKDLESMFGKMAVLSKAISNKV